MKKLLYLLICLPCLAIAQIAEVRINEIEPTTIDTGAFEFIELYGPPGQNLDSLTLVLFNGINSQSYFSLDLDGYTLDQEGFLMLAPNNTFCADLFIGVNQNWIQDGTDGIALFIGSAADWPNGTLVQNSFLLDAIVYGVQNNAPGLTSVLMSGQPIVSDNPALNPSSFSRISDGGDSLSSAAFTVQYPTPGYSNSELPCIAYTLASEEIILQCLDSLALFSADFIGGNGEIMSYILTDENDVILEVIENFPFDFSNYPAGEFRIRAVSHSQAQSFVINTSLTAILPYCGAGCLEVSDDYVRIIRYACSEPCISASITSSEGDTISRCFQDSSIITLSTNAVIGQTIFLLVDSGGSLLYAHAGDLFEFETSSLNVGSYNLYALNSPVLPDSAQLDSLINIPGYTLPDCFIWLNDTIHLFVNYCISCSSTSISLLSGNTDLTYCSESPEILEVGVDNAPTQGNYTYFIADTTGYILQWNDNGIFITDSLMTGQYALFGLHYAYPTNSEWQSAASSINQFPDLFYCFETSAPLTLEVLGCNNAEPCQHLFISEYIEAGTAGRAIELYNPSNQEVNLSGYRIGIFQNGDSSATLQIGLQGYVVPGASYVVASGGSMGEAFADDTTFQLIFNGNDALALMIGDSIVDVIGRVGENPASGWVVDNGSTQNAVLRRNAVFSAPETNWTLSAPQWNFFSANGQSSDFENLGSHYTQSCAIPALAGFETSALLVEESNDTVDLVVNISGLTDTAYLSVVAIDGNATINADWFFINPEYQMILPGVSQIVYQIQIVDDAVFEGQIEYVMFQLLDSTGIFLINNPTVSLSISPSDIQYTPITIEDLIIEDPDGNALYSDYYAVISGVSQGINFNPEGIEFPLVQGESALRVFNSFENFGYTFNGGDSLQIWGRLGQFSGMTEFYPDSIVVIAQGVTQESAQQVSALNEALESHLIRLDCVELADTSQWIPAGSGFDVLLQGAQGSFTLHIDLNTDIFNASVPLGKFDVVGVVVQFDESSPYNEGYSIWPRSLVDFEEFVSASFVMPDPLTFGDSGVVVTFENNSQGANSYMWDFGDGTTSDTIAPVHFYPYDFISPLAELEVSLVVNGTGCSDTSVVTVNLVYNSSVEAEANTVRCFPNPFRDMIQIESANHIERICIYDVTGKECVNADVNSNRIFQNLQWLDSGMYTLIIKGENMLEIVKLLKE